MTDEIKKYLGIDWGAARIGIALADEETRMAFVYDTLENDKDIFKNIFKIISEENISIIIIGIPFYKIKNKKEKFGGEKFGELLKKKIDGKIRIEYQNEMFTTKIAERNLIERNIKKIKRFDNGESARIILESWLK